MTVGWWMADGGLVNPVPVSACCALGVDIVIAVDLNGDIIERRFKAESVRLIIDRMTGIPPEFFRRLLNQIPARIRKQATALRRGCCSRRQTAPAISTYSPIRSISCRTT